MTNSTSSLAEAGIMHQQKEPDEMIASDIREATWKRERNDLIDNSKFAQEIITIYDRVKDRDKLRHIQTKKETIQRLSNWTDIRLERNMLPTHETYRYRDIARAISDAMLELLMARDKGTDHVFPVAFANREEIEKSLDALENVVKFRKYGETEPKIHKINSDEQLKSAISRIVKQHSSDEEQVNPDVDWKNKQIKNRIIEETVGLVYLLDDQYVEQMNKKIMSPE